MPRYSARIREWKVQKGLILGTRRINIDQNYNPRMIKEIEHIRFPNLLELTLRNNNIVSIESLSLIEMPQL